MREKNKADEESENHTWLTPHEGHMYIYMARATIQFLLS